MPGSELVTGAQVKLRSLESLDIYSASLVSSICCGRKLFLNKMVEENPSKGPLGVSTLEDALDEEGHYFDFVRFYK